MKTSANGRRLIESFEALRLTAYWDGTYLDQAKTIKRWSIGWGHTANVKEGDTCTPEQAEAWIVEDLATAEGGVDHAIHVPLNQNQFDALVSFDYNAGSGALASSTLAKLVNAGAMAQAALQFTLWDHADGKVSPGLLRRRQAEQALFMTPVEVAS